MGCAESNMRKEEVESALAKEEDEEMSWIQRLLKTCSYSSTRRQNVGLIAAILPEPSQRPITKTVVLEDDKPSGEVTTQAPRQGEVTKPSTPEELPKPCSEGNVTEGEDLPIKDDKPPSAVELPKLSSSQGEVTKPSTPEELQKPCSEGDVTEGEIQSIKDDKPSKPSSQGEVTKPSTPEELPKPCSERHVTEGETLPSKARSRSKFYCPPIIMDINKVTPRGCAYEIPMDRPASAKPPQRLAKQSRSAESREQKLEKLRMKMEKAEERKQAFMKQYEEKMKAKERRWRSNQNAIDLAREYERIEVDARRIAKQAIAQTLKQERIQEKIDKLKEQQERHKREKVVKKRRASRLENMKAKISGGRGNKVAPLLFDNSNSTATNPAANQDERPLSRSTINMPYQAQVPADESSASSDWNSMFGAI